MIESHLHDWLSLLLRWSHLVTGIAWIGASFYFNWLENHLQRQNPPAGIAGDLWAVHGGGFYYLQKFETAPPALPPTLHWFKWEAYTTWLTGFALLVTIYYWDAGLFMIEGGQAVLSPFQAVTAGIAALLLSWLVYDAACRSPLLHRPALLALLVLAWFTGLAWLLGQLLSPRAAYVHVGAAIGTVMVANVFRVIIPAQKELVGAMSAGRPPDAEMGRRALMRSRHNNYLTLPVLFVMISSHYPATYGHPQAWGVLLLISLAGVAVRHWFNIRHLPGSHALPLLLGLGLLAVVVAWTRPAAPTAVQANVPPAGIAEVFGIVQRRCVACHAEQPGNAAFPAAPLGIELDSMDKLRQHAERVYNASVITRTMPLGNLTGMTEEERNRIAGWLDGHQASTE